MVEDPALEIRFALSKRPEETTSGLLIAAIQKARDIRFFETLTKGLNLKMKVYRYSHQNKIETIVAGVAVGCRHTAEMQTRLVPDTLAAGLFGMERFPDQSQVNIFLRRCTSEQVAHLGGAHRKLLFQHTQGANRTLWGQLPNGQPVLPIDLDQTPLVTRSKRAEGTAAGYFGKKRGNVGYKKSLAFLGARVKEVLWLHLEPGNVHGQDAVHLVLEQIAGLCQAQGIKEGEVLLRGDSQYGSVGTIRQIQAAGYHYLLKGYTPRTAKQLADNLPATAIWHYRGQDTNGSRLWVTDAQEQEFRGHDDPPQMPAVRTRTVLLVRVGFRQRRKRGKGSPNMAVKKTASFEHYVTDLDAETLPMFEVIDLYNERETEESFFRTEQDAFGAQYLRTHKGEGEEAFLWLLASTVNLLRWVQQSILANTDLANVGLTKLVTQAMRIPATVIRTVQGCTVIFPETARIVRQMVNILREHAYQPPLPLIFDIDSS